VKGFFFKEKANILDKKKFPFNFDFSHFGKQVLEARFNWQLIVGFQSGLLQSYLVLGFRV
jgi:hypothetical protein